MVNTLASLDSDCVMNFSRTHSHQSPVGEGDRQPTPVLVVPGSPGTTVQCTDSETETFETDDLNCVQGCSWLKGNIVDHGYLCKFVNVATKCYIIFAT